MRDKSKIIGFMLSFIPGLAHLYIGLKERALIFLGLLVAGFLASMFISMVAYTDVALALFMLGYAILWLIAIVDLFSAWKRIEIRNLYNSAQGIEDMNVDTKMNKKTITLALSIIPGAGHMYLGYQNKGLFIMGVFFLSIFFMGWLGISLLLFLLPLVWFYSFFDAMHLVDDSKEVMRNQKLELPNIKPEWLGLGLIAIGVIIILERILIPLIDYEIRRYIQTSIVSLIFIIAGATILIKNKKALASEGIEEVEDDNIIEEDGRNED